MFRSAFVLIGVGLAFLLLLRLLGRDLDRVKEVPRTARMLGSRKSLEDWKAENARAGRVMTWAAIAAIALGAVQMVVALMKAIADS
jgi:hypothetical protein